MHYVEGCTAPIYSSDSFHCGVIEIIVKQGRALPLHHHPELVDQRVQPRHAALDGGRGRHHGMDRCQPRQQAHDEVSVDVLDGQGRARRDSLDCVCGQGPASGYGRQGRARRAAHAQQDHVASRSARTAVAPRYRGLLKVYKGAEGASSHVQCDALLLDENSRTDTYPYIEVDEDHVTIGHEATVSKIGDEQLFYLQSRGLNEVDARAMVVSGFIEPLVKELPMEYAVEMNRLIQLQMEGTVG